MQGGDHLRVTLGSASYVLIRTLNCPLLFAANIFQFLQGYSSANMDSRLD